MSEQIIQFLTASVLLTLSPGPDIIYVMVRSMAYGAKQGIITALGLVCGIIVHTSLVAFGVSALIKTLPGLFLILKILGALYLLYLAWKVWKSDPDIHIQSGGIENKRSLELFRQGFIMNVINPKVGLFFLALFPGFLWAPEENTVYQFYVLGFLFMLQAFIIFCLVALLSGKISKFLKSNERSGLYFKWIQILVFILIAILILV